MLVLPLIKDILSNAEKTLRKNRPPTCSRSIREILHPNFVQKNQCYLPRALAPDSTPASVNLIPPPCGRGREEAAKILNLLHHEKFISDNCPALPYRKFCPGTIHSSRQSLLRTNATRQHSAGFCTRDCFKARTEGSRNSLFTGWGHRVFPYPVLSPARNTLYHVFNIHQ